MSSRRKSQRNSRTPLSETDYDVVVCGSSFAGLAIARELSGSGARVLLLDRYEIGERQTSACAAPTSWLEVMDLNCSMRQTFSRLVFHTHYGAIPYELPWTFSTFNYQELCAKLFMNCDATFEVATVLSRSPQGVLTNRGDVTAPLVVDCTGWRAVLSRQGPKPPDSPLSRGLEISPPGTGDSMEVWIDRSVVPAGYGWKFPAADEVRVGIGSYDPRFHVREPLVKHAGRLQLKSNDFHGNWIPHKLNRGVESATFFCGDSAGQCLPLTAEGIRTAFYFGIACGQEMRRVIDGRGNRETALRRYEAFCRRHDFAFTWMLRWQRLIPKVPPPLLHVALHTMGTRQFVRWSFNHYMRIAHFTFAAPRNQRAGALGLVGK